MYFTLRLLSPIIILLSPQNDVLSILVEILNLGNSSVPIIDDDSHERICLCKALLQNTSSTLSQVGARVTNRWCLAWACTSLSAREAGPVILQSRLDW